MASAGNSRERPVRPDSGGGFPTSGSLEHQKLVSGEEYQQVSRLTVWVHRLSMVVLVVFCIELGMLLTILPWTRVWTENSLLMSYPALGSFLRNDFARGAITGLGLIDIWIGIWEAVHYSDPGSSKAAVRLS
jgi:hypothetical protein